MLQSPPIVHVAHRLAVDAREAELHLGQNERQVDVDRVALLQLRQVDADQLLVEADLRVDVAAGGDRGGENDVVDQVRVVEGHLGPAGRVSHLANHLYLLDALLVVRLTDQVAGLLDLREVLVSERYLHVIQCGSARLDHEAKSRFPVIQLI